VAVTEPLERLKSAIKNCGPRSSDYDLNIEVTLPPNRKLRPAAVLLPFFESGGELRLLLTKRASFLRHHPGQIALPGGKIDAEDSGPKAAALREAQEEIGLAAEGVTILGQLPVHETVTGFSVTPVVAHVTGAFDPRPEPQEVEEIFSVPFQHVASLENYSVQSRLWQGRRRFYYTVPYGPYYIWGATARILRGLAEALDS